MLKDLNQVEKSQRPIIPKYLSIILSKQKGCRDIYDKFISIQHNKLKCELKWENILNIHRNTKWWQNHHIIPFDITKDTKLQWIQFRIIHRIIATNSFLKKIGYRETNLCTFCSVEEETTLHLFCECNYISSLWDDFNSWLSEKFLEEISLQKQDIILGNDRFIDIVNLLIILMKSFIYQNRMNNKIPRFINFIEYVKMYQKTEKYIFTNSNNMC